MAAKVVRNPQVLVPNRDLDQLGSAGNGSVASRLPIEGLLALSLAVVLCFWVPASENANMSWLKISFEKSLYSVLITLAGLVLCLALLLAIWRGIIPFFRNRRARPGTFAAASLSTILAVAVANIFPVSTYLEVFQATGWAALPGKIVALAFSNSMMFIFFYACFSGTLVESRKAYVISSIYRDSTEDKALSEYVNWTVLSLLSPMFYYMFSFTLFSDLMYADVSYSGIVGAIFVEVLHEGWTEKALFDLGVSLVCVTLVRWIFALLLSIWLGRRDLYRRA